MVDLEGRLARRTVVFGLAKVGGALVCGGVLYVASRALGGDKKEEPKPADEPFLLQRKVVRTPEKTYEIITYNGQSYERRLHPSCPDNPYNGTDAQIWVLDKDLVQCNIEGLTPAHTGNKELFHVKVANIRSLRNGRQLYGSPLRDIHVGSPTGLWASLVEGYFKPVQGPSIGFARKEGNTFVLCMRTPDGKETIVQPSEKEAFEKRYNWQ